MKHPDVTIVIPTHQRIPSLVRALNALAAQRFPLDKFEVVVSADGSLAAARAALSPVELPYPLVVVGSEHRQGAAAARNRGAAEARGDLLVFLDDDIEPSAELISEHVNARREGAQVTIGYLRPELGPGPGDFFRVALRGWWEAMFAVMREPGHRYWFRDLLTGNCAMPATLFRQAGGFDAALQCHEDYELGVRLVARRAVMRFVERASGTHHEQSTLARSLARKREEGRADVLILRKHPELVPSLPLGYFEQHSTPIQRLLRRLAFQRPAAGKALAAALTASLPLLERGRFRGRWMKRVHGLLSYWYWRGVQDHLATMASFTAFLEECRLRSEWAPLVLEVDLSNGLELVMAQVDRRRPNGLRVMLNGVRAGEMPAIPGAEGLRGSHLKAALARGLARPLVEALGQTGAIPVTRRDEELETTGNLPLDAARF